MANSTLFNTSAQEAQCIMILHAGKQICIPFSQLVTLEADGNYTFVGTIDGKRYLASRTLKSYASVLDESLFLRIHKSTIINLKYLTGISEDNEKSVMLKNGRKMPISRRKAREIGSQLNSWMLNETN